MGDRSERVLCVLCIYTNIYIYIYKLTFFGGFNLMRWGVARRAGALRQGDKRVE
jgi:hypothetical protein